MKERQIKLRERMYFFYSKFAIVILNGKIIKEFINK